ncbi:MAG: sensor domain-containing diguanylate cyclase [Magnetococcales bacterium]|nr:sensor domain-containing diguanylate cyclase [Magnetococcales bacterium]
MNNIFFLAGMTLTTVLLLSCGWSFILEDMIDPYLPGSHVAENFSEKIEFVLTTVFFSILAMIGPIILATKSASSLKKSEDRKQLYFRIFRETSEAVLICDEQGDIIDINPAFEQMTGYSLTEVMGRNPNLLSSGQHDETFFRQMWQDIDQNGFWQGELWNRKKTGAPFVQLASISKISSISGPCRYVAIFHDITEMKIEENALRQQAQFDCLTNLPNRSLFIDRLHQAIQNTRENKRRSAILFIDLDHFKPVNDTYGHAVGDLLLKAVATRLVKQIRKEDTAARVGGDEFTVILRNIRSKEDAGRLADKILKHLLSPFDLDSISIKIGASIGISIFPDDSENLQTLLEKADQAMYHAKNSGRNQFSYYLSSLSKAP